MDCLVEYDYVAVQNDELTIQKGDLIRNVIPFEDGWKKGVLNGKEGVFPDNFVRVLKSDNLKGQPNIDVLSKFKEQLSLNVAKEDRIFTSDNHNLRTSNSQPSPALSKRNVSTRDTVTKSPTNLDRNSSTNVQFLSETGNLMMSEFSKLENLAGFKCSSLKTSKDPPESLQVVALFEYKAENPDEINLDVGEVVRVVDKHLIDDGWWKGIKKSGEVGIFPSNFVESIIDSFCNSPLLKKSFNEENNIFRQDSNGYLDHSNISASMSFNDISVGPRTTGGLMSPNKFPSLSSRHSNLPIKTRNVNVNSASNDSLSENCKTKRFNENSSKTNTSCKLKPVHHETSKCDDMSNSLDRSKVRTSRNSSPVGQEMGFVGRTEFERFRLDMETRMGKLSMRIQALLDEIDEEKKQRAASEIELVRLRRVVHMLDAQTINPI